jgi:UDP-N-acetylmuramoyl-L-alanyl-D-glutamate--2,6-diaminopimelate ligase
MTSMRLSELFNRTFAIDPEITGVTADSRQVRPGFLFAALPGAKVDGRTFVPPALEAGAAAVLAGEDISGVSVPTVVEADPRHAYALAAAAFWGDQPRDCIAVTGTNGKSSTVSFCADILMSLGRRAACMGTLGARIGGDQITTAGLTTPDAGDLAHTLYNLAGARVTHVAMEASSHGLAQRRLDGVRLTAAGFTNLTQDHLDYHGTMGAYRAAKLRLFEELLPAGAAAVLNADSDQFEVFAETAKRRGQRVISVGQRGETLKLVSRKSTPSGQVLKIEAEGTIHTAKLRLLGGFQAANALVAAGLCIGVGEEPARVFQVLEGVEAPTGRLQRAAYGPHGGEAFVDYAHTPDGLETVLNALRPHVEGKLILVFGAGGDRDRGKRPLMGEIAERLADVAIVTDDNPRSEDPAAIRAAILAAAPSAREIGDRREAIRAGAALLDKGDILLVAGKGHERGQLVAGTTYPFDDLDETIRAVEETDG